jgi:exodeoxyribonuclease-3
MKFISWNVNGLRACLQKGFLDFFTESGADFFCLQETKLQPGQLELELPGYRQFWSSAEKKGYSGTAVFAKREPLSVVYGIGQPELDLEGRMITLEYEDFFLVTCYTPNSQEGLKRLDHRMSWDDAFREKLRELDGRKPVIACGDMNVAHEEIDLKNPGPNRGSAGFSDEEREKFTQLLAAGFTDTFRAQNPDAAGVYSWWSYRFNARAHNAGWRIDYFLVSDRLRGRIAATPIYQDIFGSDHCPVGLELKEESVQ